jgi:hypothetical protein
MANFPVEVSMIEAHPSKSMEPGRPWGAGSIAMRVRAGTSVRSLNVSLVPEYESGLETSKETLETSI